MKTDINRCEDAHLLISAALDDDLTIEERMQLEAHLAACVECRREEMDLLRVNDLLKPAHLVEPTAVDLRPRLAAHQARWISLAAAAALVLLTAAAVLMRSPAAVANPMLGPLSAAHEITAHKRAAQDTVLQTMEWELRTLKLRLAEMESSDPARQQEINERLQSLLDRVNRAQE